MTDPRPCSIPPQLIDSCRQCGTRFLRRDEGPMERGFCGNSCEYEQRYRRPEASERK